MDNQKLTLKIFLALMGVYIVLLCVQFKDFIFDEQMLLVASDQLNGIGTKYFSRDSFFIPLWTQHILGGMPTLDAMFGDVYHPLNWLSLFMDPARTVGYKFILTVLVAFLSGVVLFSYMSKDWRVGGFCALLFSQNSQFFSHIYSGHDGKMYVISVIPLAIYGLYQFTREKKLWGLSVMTFSIGYMISSSHVQLTYLTMWGLLAITIYEVFIRPSVPMKQKVINKALVSLAVIVGLGLGAVQLIPPYFYSTQDSVRATSEKTSYDHSISWQLHQEEIGALVLPGFLRIFKTEEEQRKEQTTGQRQPDPYWGKNAFKLNYDTPGMLLLILAFVGLSIKKGRKDKVFWLVLASISFAYAIGSYTPFFKIFYNLVPGVDKFRGPSMLIFWFPVALCCITAISFKDIFSSENDTKKPLLMYAGMAALLVVSRYSWEGAIGGLGLIFVLIATGIINYGLFRQYNGEGAEKTTKGAIKNIPITTLVAFNLIPLASIFLMWPSLNELSPKYFKPININTMNATAGSIIPSFIMTVVFCGAIHWLKIMKQPFKIFIVALAVAGALSATTRNAAFVQVVEKKYYVTETPFEDYVLKQMKDPKEYRILPLHSRNVTMAYVNGSRIPNGFHDNEIATYRAFRGGTNMQNLLSSNNFAENPFLALLGIKYILVPNRNPQTAQTQPVQIIQNTGAFSFSTIYPKFSVEESNEAIITSLQNGTSNYRSQIILNEAPAFASPSEVDSSFNATSNLVENHGDEFILEAQSSSPGVLMLSENFHKFWKAEVNGKPAKVLRAFSTLQAVEIPEGKSSIRFYYQSPFVDMSVKLFLVSLILALLSIGLFFYKPKSMQQAL